MSLNKSKIDYVWDPILTPATGRRGHTHNICTGCKHGCEFCYARRMVEEGRLKGHPAYPYGFAPTFHPERVRAFGGKPKVIFDGNMADYGGDWDWKNGGGPEYLTPNYSSDWIAREMVRFALLNPQHIILLLTKNPAWYRFAEWPDNVWCGFSATNNEELFPRWKEILNHCDGRRTWISLEPWLDDDPPDYMLCAAWLVVGGLTGPNAKPVSAATRRWLWDSSIQAKRFTKANVGWGGGQDCPREYPDSWKVNNATT